MRYFLFTLLVHDNCILYVMFHAQFIVIGNVLCADTTSSGEGC